jgi:hypothetical protein
MRSRGAWLMALALLGCKQEDEPAAYPAYQQTYPAPPNAPAQAPGGMPAPATAPSTPAMAPAFGFLCATDQDAQCPFGRCIGGHCGGCTSVADCKPSTQCLPSFVGQVCLPGFAPTPPVAAPAPAATIPSAPAPVPAAPAPAPAPAAAASPFERARQLCVTRTNDFRARVGIGPVARRPDAEACGDAEARSDGASRTAHGAFGQCRERAQNECPAWDGPPEQVVDRCLAMMFAEGPGSGPAHGHYMNMTDGKYRGVACGFATMPSGELWVVQNFYP